tara:strand:+ start:306 stop:998 length:693 start_codon:yes stop_codon:yes gene_type:complete
MGLFDSIGGLLGGDSIEDQMNSQFNRQMQMWKSQIAWMKKEYAKTAGEYTAGYQKAIGDWDVATSEARAGLEESFAREKGYLGVGKENVMRQVQQSYDQQRGATLASNIMSGLQGTSFGTGQQTALARAETQDIGNVETQYAQQFAGMEQRQGAQMQGFEQWRIGGKTGLQTDYTQGLGNLRGSWADRISGQQGRGLDIQGAWGQGLIGNTQSNVAMGQNVMGNILGGLF